MCCCGCIEEKEPPTESCANQVHNLTILMWCTLGFGLLKLLTGDASSFADFIGCFILYWAYIKISYCSCIVYIFFQMLNIFSCFLLFGKRIQNSGTLFYRKSQNKNLIIISLIFSCIFYICSIFIVFLAYREFKATDYEQFIKEQEKIQEEQEYISTHPKISTNHFNHRNNGYTIGGNQPQHINQPYPQQQPYQHYPYGQPNYSYQPYQQQYPLQQQPSYQQQQLNQQNQRPPQYGSFDQQRPSQLQQSDVNYQKKY